MEYRIDIFTSGISDPKEKLKACLRLLAEEKKYDPTFEFVNEEALHRIVISELDKTFLTKEVDEHNKDGLFGGFKTVCRKISQIILEVSPNYPFANALVSTILVTVNQQLFFASHLPSLTSIKANEARYTDLYSFIESVVFRSIQS